MYGRAQLKCAIQVFRTNLRCRSLNGIRKSRHSRRSVPPKRSHTELACGARTGVRSTRAPMADNSYPVPVRKCCPGHESRIDTHDHPEVPPGTVAPSTPPSGEPSRCDGELCRCPVPALRTRTACGMWPVIGVKYFSRLRTTIFPFCFDKAKQ